MLIVFRVLFFFNIIYLEVLCNIKILSNTIPLSLSPLYPSLSLSIPISPSLSLPLSPSLSLSIPLYPSLLLSLPLSLSLISPSISMSLLLSLPLSLSLLSLPPSLCLSFYFSFSLFPSLYLLFIIFFGVSNGRFRPC